MTKNMNSAEKPCICYVNPPVLLKRPIAEIISRLTDGGYKTSLLIPKKLFKKRDSSLYHSKLAENSKVYTYSIINPPFISSEQPLPITPMFLINAIKAMKKNDIIHMWVPYYLTSLKIILMKKLFFPKKKLILTMDTVPGYSFSMGKSWDRIFKIYNKMFGWLLFGTPNIITLYGKSLVPYAIKARMPEEKLRVIPTGIKFKELEQKERQKNRADIRSEVNSQVKINPNTSIVLFIGLLVPRKGVDKIIKIADKLRKKDVVFLVVGDGPRRKEYEQQVRQLKLENKVLFLGWRADTPRLYQTSDILVLPAEGEGLPGVVMEAMSFGIPCVASNIPCIPDLIEDGKSGYLCDKDDFEEFAARINELVSDKNKRKRIGEQALKRIKLFDWEKIISKYEELYYD